MPYLCCDIIFHIRRQVTNGAFDFAVGGIPCPLPSRNQIRRIGFSPRCPSDLYDFYGDLWQRFPRNIKVPKPIQPSLNGRILPRGGNTWPHGEKRHRASASPTSAASCNAPCLRHSKSKCPGSKSPPSAYSRSVQPTLFARLYRFNQSHRRIQPFEPLARDQAAEFRMAVVILRTAAGDDAARFHLFPGRRFRSAKLAFCEHAGERNQSPIIDCH